jgi:hypothetical protein
VPDCIYFPGETPDLSITIEQRCGDLSRFVNTRSMTARVTVLDPQGIERSVGKARRIVDRRPNE